VTDAMLMKFGLVQKCLDSLTASGCKYEVFDKVVPNPPSEQVDEGYEIYKQTGCDSIIGFGGGSPMDVAKIIGAKVCNPKPIESYQGYFRATVLGLHTMPHFMAVPTTAGTGSETTIAAIISIKSKNKKIAIADLGLVPHDAVLDPEILVKLPKHITAATGMDALTHAVESFLSGWQSTYTKKMSEEAVSQVFKSLITSYKDGSDLAARESMLDASFKAGVAFTRANVGYVHAIAHQLGGMFNTPHGDANAMLLPHVLAFYLSDELHGGSCTNMICELAVVAGLADFIPVDTTAKVKLANAFVERIQQMNLELSIPSHVNNMKAGDVAEVAKRALNEAHGMIHNPFSLNLVSWILDLGYPNPKYMTQPECEAIIRKVLSTAA